MIEKLQEKDGASEGIRTLDIHLGKVMLYQLSYARFRKAEAKDSEFSSAGKRKGSGWRGAVAAAAWAAKIPGRGETAEQGRQ